MTTEDTACWRTIVDATGDSWTAEQYRSTVWLGRRAAKYTRNSGYQPGKRLITIGSQSLPVGTYPSWAIDMAIRDGLAEGRYEPWYQLAWDQQVTGVG